MSSRPVPEGATAQTGTASGQGRVIQAGRDLYMGVPAASPTPQALEALPPAPRLTGRTEQTDRLVKALSPEAGAGTVTVVTGLPGVGKTALALHAAHRAVDRGHFPGGTLFVHLRGYAPAGALGPEQALESLLRALGVRTEDLPPTVEEQSGLYQSELARRAKEYGPVLILADDASSPGQLLPLVPAHPSHRLLVTSRDALTAPDFRPRLVPLDELDVGSAVTLVTTALTQVRDDDPRAEREPEALERLAGHCGGLPLALTIAAALLTDDPGLPIATLADDLADARTRLESLRHEDVEGRTSAVRAAFDLSYRRLKAEDARLFRLLSLHPGPDVSTECAAVLNGSPARESRAGLAALARACLISEHPTGSDRWRTHDLIRLYARGLPPQEAEAEAVGRALTHYAVTGAAARARLNAEPGAPAAGRFPDRTAALAWLDAEHTNLMAWLPISQGFPGVLIPLTEILGPYQRLRRRFRDALVTRTYAVAAALEGDDTSQQAWTFTALGTALHDLRLFEEAIAAHTRAVGLYEDTTHHGDHASALNGLGMALGEVRRFDEAIDVLTRAAPLSRTFDDPRLELGILNNLGIALQAVGRLDEAIEVHRRNLVLYRELDDRASESAALNNLGVLLRITDRPDEAVDAHAKGLALCRQGDDRYSEGLALSNLALALHATGRSEEAVSALTQCVEICRELDDLHGEGQTLNNLGGILHELGRLDEGAAHLGRAVDIFRDLGDVHRHGQALNNLGLALRELQRLDEAVSALNRAADIFRRTGDEPAEAVARHLLESTLLQQRRPSARRGWRRWFHGRGTGTGAGAGAGTGAKADGPEA
ncbi:tetratricopeptide repeat protein [Streptomyces sp. NPDC056144]|uniref:tetratricopeptide repeat protein n=1 Tax=unclassified Streptomyces TaxID=2593676 RepID=UPI0035E0613D